MVFRTELPTHRFPFQLDYQHNLLFLGSCFSDNIASNLIESAFKVESNPFGVLYNPISIKNALNSLMQQSVYQEKDLFYHKGLYHSFEHHSRFSKTDVQQTLANINQSLSQARAFFSKTNYLFITFGSAYVYEHIEEHKIVSNCHKLPAKSFKHYLLSPQEIVKQYKALIQKINDALPQIKIVFTVSPVRYIKDSFRDNQLSKSYLHYSIAELEKAFDNVFYYPAYEIIIDDLRDYRFFKEDLIHPNNQAINYVYEHFRKCFFSEQTIQIEQKVLKLRQAFKHKPFNPETKEHQAFLQKSQEKLNQLLSTYPNLQW